MNVLDLTGWYAKDFLTSKFRKSRLGEVWLNTFLRLPAFCHSKKTIVVENKKLENFLLAKPMPKIVSEFKDHPLYVIEKDLLKFEAIYPKDTEPLGQIRNQNIYPRSAVFVCQGELNWIRYKSLTS